MPGSLRERLSKRPLVLHPLLFVAYAVLSLLATNITQVSLDGLSGLFVTVFLILVLLPLLNLIFKHPQKTGLLSSVAILLIFAYSHVKSFTGNWQVAGVPVGQPLILIPIGLGLFGLWVFIVYKKLTDIKRAAQYFTVVGLVLLIFPSLTIGNYLYQGSSVNGQGLLYSAEAWEQTGGVKAEQQIGIKNGEVQRDVYYIILDAYTRQDILKEVFAYDNAWFIEALQARGFYVAEASQSNYPDTMLSLASSLNMVQLDGLPDYLTSGSQTNEVWRVEDAVNEMLKQNHISQIFRQMDYEVVAFDTGFVINEFKEVDHYLISPELEGSDTNAETAFEILVKDILFGELLGDVTQRDIVVPLQDLFYAHRVRVQYTLENVDHFAKEDGNYFVFAHVVSPHVPFVFGSNGEEVVGTQFYTLSNPNLTYDESIIGYRDQVHYLNSLVLAAIDDILAQSETPPIIILQGDHGSRLEPTANREDDLKGYLDSQYPILNAYYLPDADVNSLYPTISPVNSFRVVLNQYFGTELKYLEDLSYLDTYANADFEFVEICKEFSYCLNQ